ncbi:MAG: M1 family aminopeptidase [Candidatus Eisenbacteria bacterium]
MTRSRWGGVGAALLTALVGFDLAAAGVSYPPPNLVTLENPAQAAILRHDVEAGVDPRTSTLRARDRVTLLHAKGVASSTPCAVLLWRDLKLEGAPTCAGHVIRAEEPPRFVPRDFWHRPPFDELDGYERAREIRLTLESESSWPETLVVEFSYSGVIADSLRPPKEDYERSFEVTAGLIEPRGVYLASGSFWVPTRPDEVFTFSLAATTPSGWRAVSQGELTSPLEPGASGAPQVDRWECAQPMQEVYFVAGPWVAHELVHRGVRCQTFTHAETDSSVYNRYLRGTGRYLDLYGDRIGPYAFTKFALVENFWQSGYGMPSFTLLGDKVIRLPFILDTSYGHEILHNWWGNGVFVKAEEGNWCEGLTVYGADYLYKEREGALPARQYRLDALKGYLNDVGEGRDFALRAFRERSDAASASIGYAKSMMVLHQIRRAVGDGAFWAGLQGFYRANLWRRASWLDLFRAIDVAAAGSSFKPEEYVAQWIDREGAPALALRDCRTSQADSGVRVDARLEVTGVPGGEQSYQDAELPVVELVAGAPVGAAIVPLRATMVDGSVRDYGLPLRGGAFHLVLPSPPRALALDPDFEVMRKLERAEIPATIDQTIGLDSIAVVYASDLSAEQRKSGTRSWRVGPRSAASRGSRRRRWRGWVPSTWRVAPRIRPHRASPDRNASGGRGADRTFGRVDDRRAALPRAIERDPDRRAAGQAGSIVDPARDSSASLVPRVDGKVPHYRKYSWLAFDGETNVGKGSWLHTSSPLTVQFDAP